MAEGKMTAEWDHTAALLAKIHNVNCTKKNQMITNPMKLNPMRVKEKKKSSVGIQEMAKAMMGGWTRGANREPIIKPDIIVEE